MTDQEKLDFLKSTMERLFKKAAPEFTRDTTLAGLGLDSLDIVELQMEFEKEYNVQIPDPETAVETVGHLIDHLRV